MSESWFDLAAGARKAASRLISEHYRSCLSRAYYYAAGNDNVLLVPALIDD